MKNMPDATLANLESELASVIDASLQDGSNSPMTRKRVTERLTYLLGELKQYYSVPVDFSLEIDDNNNSIIIHFAKDYTTDDQD